MIPNDSPCADLLSLLRQANTSFAAKTNREFFKRPLSVALEAIKSSSSLKILIEANHLTLNLHKEIISNRHYEREVSNNKTLVSSYYALKFLHKVHHTIKNQGFFSQPLFHSKDFDDLAHQILSHLSPHYNPFMQTLPAGLNALACISSRWNLAVQRFYLEQLERHLFVNAQAHSFSTCTAIESVIKLIKERNLEVANLEEIKDVTIEQVDALFKSCPHIKHLIVSSGHLQTLPDSCCQLQTLECLNCPNLVHLPACLTQLTRLKCFNCEALKSLPGTLQNLTSLSCFSCSFLESLPENLPNLKSLTCVSCTALKSFPQSLSGLTEFSCIDCPITNLPNNLIKLARLVCRCCKLISHLPDCLTQLKHLDCSSCDKITYLPTCLARLEILYCGGCLQLKSLPECLTQLKSLNCEGCTQLERLPECLVQLVTLDCESCHRLEDLPECLVQLKSLNCKFCYSLKSLPKNMPQLKTLSYMGVFEQLHLNDF